MGVIRAERNWLDFKFNFKVALDRWRMREHASHRSVTHRGAFPPRNANGWKAPPFTVAQGHAKLTEVALEQHAKSLTISAGRENCRKMVSVRCGLVP
jgi:hypothetical protein